MPENAAPASPAAHRLGNACGHGCGSAIGRTILNGTSRKQRQRSHRHGIICRSRPAADGVAEAIETCGLKLGVDAQIGLLDVYQNSTLHAPPFPHLMMAMNPETIGQHIGQFLIAQAQGAKVETQQEMIPMVLVDKP